MSSWNVPYWLTLPVAALVCAVVGWGVIRDRRCLKLCWLYPVRDLLGFCTWALSFAGNKFFWRGEPYQFGAEGRITPVQRSIDFAPERVAQAHQQMDRAPSAAATGD